MNIVTCIRLTDYMMTVVIALIIADSVTPHMFHSSFDPRIEKVTTICKIISIFICIGVVTVWTFR